MNASWALLAILFLVFLCQDASMAKNDRHRPPFNDGSKFIQRNRRLALNEYLVPPPPPRHQPFRSGRVINQPPTESPGYFSRFMNWLNPFNFGPSPSHIEAPYPPSVQPRGPPPFNLHSAPQAGSSLHPPPGPLYPPLGPPNGQYPAAIVPHPHGVPAAPLNLPPNPPLPTHNAPPVIFQNTQHGPPPLKNNPVTSYVAVNKGRLCNPCNRLPWIPMQGGGLRTDDHLHPPQLSNGYLPPGNPTTNHDAQHAASHEVNVPSIFSQVPVGQPDQNPSIDPSSNSQLYLEPIPPLYDAESFDGPPPSFHTGDLSSPEIDGHFNIRGNEDSSPSGTRTDLGYASAVPQHHGTELEKGLSPHQESFGTSVIDNQSPISGPSSQVYRNPSSSNQLDQSLQGNHPRVNALESSNFGSQDERGNGYRESFNSNSDANVHPSYLPYQNTQDLNPSASFGTAVFNDQNVGGLNSRYSDDLSASSSVLKDSHATTQVPRGSASVNNDFVHFEESPLLDLTKKDDTQWPTSTVSYNTKDVDNTLKTTTDYSLETDNVYFDDTSNFIKTVGSYTLPDTEDINGAFETATPTAVYRDVEVTTTSTLYANQQGVSYIPVSGQSGSLWANSRPNTLNLQNDSLANHASLDPLLHWNDSSVDVKKYDKQESLGVKDLLTKPHSVKRNKQVQVVIPYTSEYTPIPFQQSYGDWSVRTTYERTQPRKAQTSSEHNIDNYVQQESRNNIRVINNLQSPFDFNKSNKSNVQSIRTSTIAVQNSTRNTVSKVNNSIDVRRLQKNIDNWTIQEYSKPTTSNTILPSSPHPYLSPSKKIPTKYLTTTEPGDHASDSNDHNESVKTYSLAGFSFNEVEHEGSASNHIEETRTPVKVLRVETTERSSTVVENTNKSATEEKSTWKAYTASVSTVVDKQRVYVVTPQPVLGTTLKDKHEKAKEKVRENSRRTSESKINDGEESNGNISEFEEIEKAYQVLPQAVNNLAVASTGKENVPLWGIMEHEEFASLNLGETGDGSTGEGLDGPVLYSGHSKVSRAKR